MDSVACSVLVVSCDRSKDLWTPFFKLFWRYWPDCPFPVYLGSNCASVQDERVLMLHAGVDKSWSCNLRYFLNQIHSEYVLMMLEDFFLTTPISSSDVIEKLARIHALAGTVLRLYPNPPPDYKLHTYSDLGAIHRLAPHRVSAQPSIWNRAALLRILRDGESPWEFESAGTLRCRAQHSGFYSTRQPSVPYRHVVERGRWFWSAARRYGNANIGCDFTARPVMGPLTAFKKILGVRFRRTRHWFRSVWFRLTSPEQPAE